VTFAGSVAGMRTVTIEPVPGFKVSVSYLSEIVVETGQTVEWGQIVGRSGSPHGVQGVHLSTRIDGRYVDPEHQLGCRETDITRALRLVTPPAPYPRRSAHRHTRRDL
jgi:murein DD-endopeptidase MepM/ murein hydrolase activator NlpD